MDMKDYFEHKIENNNLLFSIDASIKKARKLELCKCPYAIVVNPNNACDLNLDSLTYLSKNGFQSIPIIRHKNITKDTIKLAYDEDELIKIIKK